jgi:cyclase
MRRLLLVASASAQCLAALGLGSQQAPLRMDAVTIRPRVHVFSGFTNGNVLLLESSDGLLLVDAQTIKRVASLDSAIAQVSRAPVRWVVNTHYHADHTEGNAHFRARGARVLAHERVRVHAAKDTTITELEWHRTPLPHNAMPTDAFATRHDLRLGVDQVVVLHPGPAHTDGDAMVWLPALNVLHIGDILEVDAPPFVDWWAGGSVDGMVRAIDDVLTWTNDSTAIVPGHGPVSTRGDLRRFRAMLVTVQERVRGGLVAGTSLPQLEASAVAGFEKSLGGERRARQFAAQVILGLRRLRS